MKKYLVIYELNAHRIWLGSYATLDEAARHVVPVERGRFSILTVLEYALPAEML